MKETERREEEEPEYNSTVLGGLFSNWDYIGKRLSKNDKQKGSS